MNNYPTVVLTEQQLTQLINLLYFTSEAAEMFQKQFVANGDSNSALTMERNMYSAQKLFDYLSVSFNIGEPEQHEKH